MYRLDSPSFWDNTFDNWRLPESTADVRGNRLQANNVHKSLSQFDDWKSIDLRRRPHAKICQNSDSSGWIESRFVSILLSLYCCWCCLLYVASVHSNVIERTVFCFVIEIVVRRMLLSLNIHFFRSLTSLLLFTSIGLIFHHIDPILCEYVCCICINFGRDKTKLLDKHKNFICLKSYSELKE